MESLCLTAQSSSCRPPLTTRSEIPNTHRKSVSAVQSARFCTAFEFHRFHRTNTAPAGSPKARLTLLTNKTDTRRDFISSRHDTRTAVLQRLPSVFMCSAGREQPASLEDKEEAIEENLSITSDVEFELKDGWQWSKTGQELLAYTLLLAAVPIVPMLPRFQWSGAFYFLFLALWSVYVGSHRSLGQKPPQRVSFKQGLAVPLFCSVSLFGFYSLLRLFPNFDLRTFISAYLGLAGAVAVTSNLTPPLRLLLPTPDNLRWKIGPAIVAYFSWEIFAEFPKWLVEDEGRSVHLTITPAEIVATLLGVGAAVASKQSGAPFTLNNFIAVCIVTELLQLLSLGSFATAAAMLCGLLLYDVFWVFGSSHVFGDNVMVTVATSSAFDGPMKLIFPQFNASAANPYSILGLGDIAAPGLLIAFMLRFDRSRSEKLAGEVTGDQIQTADKTYFVTCIASYVFGLTLTIVANTVSGAAQPALLYLVPSLLFGVFVVAASRSEATLLFDYKEEQLSPVPVKSEDQSLD